MDEAHQQPTATRRTRRRAPGSLSARIQRTLTELAGLSSVSGQEDDVRAYLRTRLEHLGLAPHMDGSGNVIATVPGTGAPLLLNAHMDRVPPGRGHVPRVAHGRMYSDGNTNLGADDSAGLTIILETLDELAQRALSHRRLVVLFTVGEEIGMRGAAAFDPAPWRIAEGLVFDNAGPAGAIVVRGASYVAFDAVLYGRGGHPGKELAGTASAIDIFRRVRLPRASLDGDTTRISIGTLAGGIARNAIASEVRLSGEVRTLLRGAPLVLLLASIEQDLLDAAQEAGGTAECLFEPHGSGYLVAGDEPLLHVWQDAWAARGQTNTSLTSFIGSDTNALRKRLRALTISTGVEGEHTTEESIALAPLAELVEATVDLLTRGEGPTWQGMMA